MKIHNIYILIFLLFPLFLIAQPQMSVWKVDHKSNTPIFLHTTDNNAILWDCGYEYYSFYEGPGVVKETVLHVLNEGSDTLVISEPILADASSEFNLDLLGVQGNIKIAPNHEFQIIVRYTGPPTYASASAKLIINSNDPSNTLCNFEFGIGATIREASINDPCGCDNIIAATNPSGFLYVDTMTFTGSPIVYVKLVTNNNPNGFLDITGVPISDMTILGMTNTGGVLKYPFYRTINEGVDIDIDGLGAGMNKNFTFPACTDICMVKSIPTISEWGIIVLSIIMMIFGIVAVRNRQSSRG